MSSSDSLTDCDLGCLCHFSPKAFLARITAFVDSVSDPDHPACCPRCTNLLAHELSRGDERVTLVQRHFPEFFEVCMRLLTLYADTNIPQLRQRLINNQKTCPHRVSAHRLRLPCGMTDPVDMLIWALYKFAHCGMIGGERPIDRAACWHKPPFYKRNGFWPGSLYDLFPCGVEEGVNALVFWCCAPPSALTFDLLATVIFTARGVVVPHLLKSPARERLIWAMLQALSHGPVPWSGEAPFRLPPGLMVPRSLRGAPFTVDQVLELLNTLHEGYGAQTHQLPTLVRGYERVLLCALEPHVLLYADETDSPEHRRTFRSMLEDQIHLLRALLYQPGGAMPSRDGQCPAEVIREATVRLFCSRYCSRTGCGAHELSERGLARFGVCSYCRLARYCSRECQRAGWSDSATDGVAHKVVCPLLSKLFSHIGMVPDANTLMCAFDCAFPACDFDAKDVRMLHRWAVTSGVLPASRETLQLSRPAIQARSHSL